MDAMEYEQLQRSGRAQAPFFADLLLATPRTMAISRAVGSGCTITISDILIEGFSNSATNPSPALALLGHPLPQGEG
jgi:hypothetical protein